MIALIRSVMFLICMGLILTVGVIAFGLGAKVLIALGAPGIALASFSVLAIIILVVGKR